MYIYAFHPPGKQKEVNLGNVAAAQRDKFCTGPQKREILGFWSACRNCLEETGGAAERSIRQRETARNDGEKKLLSCA